MRNPTAMVEWMTSALSYGDDPDQIIEISSDGNSGPVVALLHGGYWRASFGRQLMWPLAIDLERRGLDVANIEYRRGSDWRDTVDDVGHAIEALRGHFPAQSIIVVGHSAGGHLALLHAGSADAVLALAPVTDVVRGHYEGIGENAVAEFVGASPQSDPAAYARITPEPRTIDIPTMFVHGQADERVPVAHTDSFVQAISEAHERPPYLRPADVGHLEVIDPQADCWSESLTWIRGLRLPIRDR